MCVCVPDDYGVYCELYGKAGYYCASMVNPQAGRDEFIYCNAKGSYAFELVCAEGSYCNLTGFSDANPCMARTDSATPVCGNGVVERGEECEKGAGCDPETCKCKNGFYPPATPDGTCICKHKHAHTCTQTRHSHTFVIAAVVANAVNYSAVCEIIHERKNKTETYYFCPTFYSPLADSTVIVECATGKPVNHTKCPDGKFCSVPGLFTENVCASAAPMCGNGKLEEGEECEAEGVGCDPEMCRCEKGYHATEEPSVNCVKDVEPKTVKSYSELCAAFEIPGYFCAAAFNKSEPDTMALQCGANGALSGEFYCPPGTTCKTKDFTIYNPCEDPAATTRCGDGIISGDEECELGGTGCDEKECTCLPGYVPTVPPSRSCELNDYSKICLDHGLGKDKTLALCLDGFNKSFLICSKDNATASFMTACPPGTSCTNKNEPIDGMPCTAIVAAV